MTSYEVEVVVVPLQGMEVEGASVVMHIDEFNVIYAANGEVVVDNGYLPSINAADAQ